MVKSSYPIWLSLVSVLSLVWMVQMENFSIWKYFPLNIGNRVAKLIVFLEQDACGTWSSKVGLHDDECDEVLSLGLESGASGILHCTKSCQILFRTKGY